MAKKKGGKDLATLVAAGGLWAWQNRDRIRDFLRSEQVEQALKTPQAQQVISSPAARRILEHPQVQSVLASPEFQRWLNGQQGAVGQAGVYGPPSAGGQGPDQAGPQEPYTGETRRL